MVIFLLTQSVWSYSQSDLSLKTNELSLSLFRFEHTINLNPYNPRLFLGVNYGHAIKPKFWLNASVEGFVHNKPSEGPYPIYDYYVYKFKEFKVLLGYKYLFDQPIQKGMKFYLGNNLFYRNYSIGSEYILSGETSIITNNSNSNLFGFELNLGFKIYLNQKFVITPEYAANYNFSKKNYNLLLAKLKLGVLF